MDRSGLTNRGGGRLPILFALGLFASCEQSIPPTHDGALARDQGSDSLLVDSALGLDKRAGDGLDAGTDAPIADSGGELDAASDTSAVKDGPLPVAWDPKQYPWPMYGRDPRRTSRSPFVGPKTATPTSPLNWTYDAPGAVLLNIQAVVTSQGVYFGGWGVQRRLNKSDAPNLWDKMDGRYYGLSLQGLELFPPLLPAVTPVGYLYAAQPKLGRDVFWVGAGNDFHLSFFNGTIEGTACVDPDTGVHYVGRGDGKLYAIDPLAGKVKWAFNTFDPVDPQDPEGGGEIIGGPVMAPDRLIYFGTAGLPWPGTLPDDPAYETNAVYAVNQAGKLVWRYPSKTASVDNFIFTPPALAPDGKTLYLGTYAGDTTAPGKLLAFDLTKPPAAPDDQRLKWSLELVNPDVAGKPSGYVFRIAVGIDGRIFLALAESPGGGAATASLVAVNPNGTFAWSPPFAHPQGYPAATQMGAGFALAETSTSVETVFFSTTHVGRANGDGGALFAIDPNSGSVMATFDPGKETPKGIGGMTAPTLDKSGTIYVGIRGKSSGVGLGTNGRMYAVTHQAGQGFKLLWQFEVDGQLDWVPPAIGNNGGLFFGSSVDFPLLLHGPWDNAYHAPGVVPALTTPKVYAIFD
jgi:outer membrane protein assembly factor BamB